MHVHTVLFIAQLRVNTILSCFHYKNIQQNVSDAWFIWHMWSTVSLYVSTPSSHYAVYLRAQFHIVIYSWSLRTSQTHHPHHHHHRRLHPVWCLSSFSTGSRRRRKPAEEKRCGTRLQKGPTSFFVFVKSCHSLQLCLRRGARPNCWGAPLQLSELRLDVVAETQRVQRERAAELSASSHRPLQMSSCWEQIQKDDFAVTHFGLRVSVDSWQTTEVFKAQFKADSGSRFSVICDIFKNSHFISESEKNKQGRW